MRPDPTGVRKVLLKDLDDPAVCIVSFVKNPAVRDAKFFALKSEEAASASRIPVMGLRGQVRSTASQRRRGGPETGFGQRMRIGVKIS